MNGWEYPLVLVLAYAIYLVGYKHGLNAAARMADQRRKERAR